MGTLRIAGLTVEEFACPFVRPPVVAGQSLAERRGFYLTLIADDGTRMRGEAAPLPGISPESLQKAGHDLNQAQGFLKGREFSSGLDALTEALREDARLSACCPSVRFAVESALFGLAAAAQGKSLAVFIGAGPLVPGAVLLQGTCEQVLAEARAGAGQGHLLFKLKVGDRNVAIDVKKVQDVRAAIGSAGTIRLDANRSWSFEEAVLFAQLAGCGQIEFIEEPLKDMDRAPAFWGATGMPVALDETLQVMRCGVSAPGRCAAPLAASDAVAAYVVKPMIVGGLVRTMDWIAEAARLGKTAVVSSAFETPVGMTVLEALAGLTGKPPGLDTAKWFG